jgi:hypothetical protein
VLPLSTDVLPKTIIPQKYVKYNQKKSSLPALPLLIIRAISAIRGSISFNISFSLFLPVLHGKTLHYYSKNLSRKPKITPNSLKKQKIPV